MVGKVLERAMEFSFTADENICWFREKMAIFSKVERMWIHDPENPFLDIYYKFSPLSRRNVQYVDCNIVTVKYVKQPNCPSTK